MTEIVKILALRLVARFGEHISAQLLLLHYNQDFSEGPSFDSQGGPMGFSGLHGAAYLGIVGMVTVLEMKEWDINAYDCMGMTPLTWACMKGQGEVVKVLLQRADNNPDREDTLFTQTPLSWAAHNGCEGAGKVLLE